MLRRVLKPWYVFRPQQMALRLLQAFSSPKRGYEHLHTAWGAILIADPEKTIGHSIWTTGVYDLNVSELLIRLIRPGDVVIDAGANIGYMTVLAASAVSNGGRVLAFEPNPELFELLVRNIENCTDSSVVTARAIALGAHSGSVQLVLPGALASNDGLSFVGHPRSPLDRSIEVSQTTLDAAVGHDIVGVLKIDVEGAEPEVLRGAKHLLRDHRVRDVIFEDHEGDGSESFRILREAGYQVFSIGRTVRGLKLGAPNEKSCAPYEAPSYLATVCPEDAVVKCESKGWRCLRLIRSPT